MKAIRVSVRALAALALAAALVFSQAALPSGVERVASVEGVTEYRLANGLRVLLFPDPSKQTMTVNVTYLVGSRHENYGETGMAHLLEHLVFKGAPRHPDIPKELTDHGARPNGTTWVDRTNYFETFQATDANLEWALDLEADRMVNSFIARKDLDSEMTVVRNEFESGENNPQAVLEERVVSTAYLWHSYGKSTIGARSDIENVSIDRLQAFYKNYYQPDNAVLLVTGKIDEAKTLALVDKFFSPIPRPSRRIAPTYTAEPVQDGERSVTLRRVGDVQAVLTAHHVPPGSHADFAAVQLATQALSTVPAGRLYKALVETKKAASTFGFTYQFKEPGLILLGAEVRKESSLADARDALLATIDSLTKQPFTAEEIERVRTQILKNIDLALNNSERFGLGMSEWIAMGDWRLFFLHRDRIRKVTVGEVESAALKYLKPANRTIGLFIPTPEPDRAEIPAAPDVAALVKDYKGDAAVAAGEAFDPSPANIDRRTRRGELGAGLKLAFLSKETRGDSVNATLRLHFGDEKTLMNLSPAARMAGSMLMRGARTRNRQQIQDAFDKLKARVSVGGGATSSAATIETTRQNLPAVLEIVAEVLREPSFPANEFDQLKQQQLAQIESMKSEPQALVFQAFERHLSPHPKGDVRYTPTFDEQIADLKAVTLEDARKFHSTFYGASKAELAIVGDFDPEEAQQLANKLFGNWKSPRPYVRVSNPYRKIPPVNQSLETPDKANAAFVAGMTLNLSDRHPDYPALTFGSYLIGGGMNSRLFARIRGKEGLSYGVGAFLQSSPEDENSRFFGFAIAAPQNTPKVEASFKDEIGKILKEGFTDEEVAAGKKGWLQAQSVSRAQDRELMSKVASWTYWGRTMAWDAELELKVEALTPAQIVEALRRHIDLGSFTIMKGGDFKKAGVTP